MTHKSNVIPFPIEKPEGEESGTEKHPDIRGVPEAIRLAIAVRAMQNEVGTKETYLRLWRILEQLEKEM